MYGSSWTSHWAGRVPRTPERPSRLYVEKRIDGVAGCACILVGSSVRGRGPTGFRGEAMSITAPIRSTAAVRVAGPAGALGERAHAVPLTAAGRRGAFETARRATAAILPRRAR